MQSHSDLSLKIYNFYTSHSSQLRQGGPFEVGKISVVLPFYFILKAPLMMNVKREIIQHQIAFNKFFSYFIFMMKVNSEIIPMIFLCCCFYSIRRDQMKQFVAVHIYIELYVLFEFRGKQVKKTPIVDQSLNIFLTLFCPTLVYSQWCCVYRG